MKRLLILLLLSACAWGTTTVTGNMQNLGTADVSGGFIRFWLRGCAGNQPRVSGHGLIAPSLGGVFFFDIPANPSGAVSGTLYSNRDSTGLLGGDIECGGSTTATWYGMQAFFAGKGGPEIPVYAKNTAVLDISSVTPLTTNPVVIPPSGDSTYLRLDAGNSPITGTLTLNSGFNVQGTSALHIVTTDADMTVGDSLEAGVDVVVDRSLLVMGGVGAEPGMQHVRQSSCTTGAGANATCATTVTWGVAFLTSTYTTVCQLSSNNTTASVTSETAASHGTASVVINITNGANGGATLGTINCIAMHDPT